VPVISPRFFNRPEINFAMSVRARYSSRNVIMNKWSCEKFQNEARIKDVVGCEAGQQ